jgi:hypothetical protein
MERRGNTRIAASQVIPVQVIGLGGLELLTSARIVNVSPNGLRMSTSEAIPVGSFLRLEFDDATIFAEVRYCERQKHAYAIGVYVEEILIGTSELARLVASLIGDNPEQTQRETARVR